MLRSDIMLRIVLLPSAVYGEKIDDNEYKKVADNNLLQALEKKFVYTKRKNSILQEKMEKRK